MKGATAVSNPCDSLGG